MQIYLILALVVALGGGTSLVAENAAPGDILYPVKIAINENVRGGLTLGAENKAEWYVQKTERRLEEAKKLFIDANADVSIKARMNALFKTQADESITAITKLLAEGGIESAARLDATLKNYIKSYEKTFIQTKDNQPTFNLIRVKINDLDIAKIKEENIKNLKIAEGSIVQLKQLLELKVMRPINTQDAAIIKAQIELLDIVSALLVKGIENIRTGEINNTDALLRQVLEATQRAQQILNNLSSMQNEKLLNLNVNSELKINTNR